MLLKLIDIAVHYGKAIALDNVSMEISEGTVVSLIGANGAGKTTVLRAVSGLIPLTSGEIWFRDRRIDGMPVPDIVKLGLIQIPRAEGFSLTSRCSVT